MDGKLKTFLCGMSLGLMFTIPVFMTCNDEAKNCLKTKMKKVKDSMDSAFQNAKKNTLSSMNEALEAISGKINDIEQTISKMDSSKVKAKAKSL